MKRSSGADRVADTGKQPGRLLILTVQGASGAHKALSVDVAGGRSCEDGGEQSSGVGEYEVGPTCTDPLKVAWAANGHQTLHNRRPWMCWSGCVVMVPVVK